MKIIQKVFVAGYSSIIFLFICCALALIFFSIVELWHGVNPTEALELRERFNAILENIGLLTIAVVSLELGQTILEEEVQREVKVRAPTRVRRCLSRFMVVVVVALSIETLVAVFQFAHGKRRDCSRGAAVGGAYRPASCRVGRIHQKTRARKS